MKKAGYIKTALFFAAFFSVFFGVKIKSDGAEAVLSTGQVTNIYGEASGTLRYTIYADGTMVITGSGPGASYRPFGISYDDKCPWDGFREQIKYVVFEAEIIGTTAPSIGGGGSINGWFTDCKSLLEVGKLPEGITDMSAAFYGCSSLCKVENIPESVKTLQYTFWDCGALTKAPALPKGLEDDMVTEFAGHNLQVSQGLLGTFHGCSSLMEAPEIPENDRLYKLVNTFEGCTALTTIREIPENITYFQATFKNCISLTDVVSIRADAVRLIDGVFSGAAGDNDYIFFVKTENDQVSAAILEALDETGRVYVWDAPFCVNFMVMNTWNNPDYGMVPWNIGLMYGSDYGNRIIKDYRAHITEKYGNLYPDEYRWFGEFNVPGVEGFAFAGWYKDAALTDSIHSGYLINPTNRQLAAGEVTIYAKMSYDSAGCVLTIDPDGGYYNGSTSITTIKEFENKSFTQNFGYTGDGQCFVVPVSGNYNLQLYGAQGGSYGRFVGGYGGMVSVMGRMEAGECLYVHVGGGGQSSDGVYAAGGYNGGGDSVRGYLYTYYDDESDEDVPYYDCCGGGGGATDIRLGNDSVLARIATAGGGGGAGRHNYWYCSSDNPSMPNVYYDDDDESYEIYNRTIEGCLGQGGSSAAGGGGGVRGGAHNYEGQNRYGKANSSYGGTNGYDTERFVCLISDYLVAGNETTGLYGKNGSAAISYSGAGYTPTLPWREGYMFSGWSIEGDGAFIENTVYMNGSNVMLRANWVPNEYLLTFDPMGGVTEKEQIRFRVDYPYGSLESFPKAYLENACFVGWYDQPYGGVEVTEGTIAKRGESITLYARYEPLNYTVVFDAAGGEVSIHSKIVQMNKKYGPLPQPVRKYYVFLGWTLEGSIIDENSLVQFPGDHILTALWKKTYPPVIEDDYRTKDWSNVPVLLHCTISTSKEASLEYVCVSRWDENGEETILYHEFEGGTTQVYEFEKWIGDAQTHLYEGITRWRVRAVDNYGNINESEYEIKLDFTPPVICGNNDSVVFAKEYVDGNKICQYVFDALSGPGVLILTPGSMQGQPADGELVVEVREAPYSIVYDTDVPWLKNEAAYILKAYDKAGNEARKIILTKASVNNTIQKVVPRKNYE